MKHEHEVQVTVPEEVTTKLERIKQHVEDNKLFYLGAPVAFVAGMYFRRPIQVIVEPVFNNNVAPVIAPVMKNIVNNGGHLTKMVKCLETDEMWETVTEAAEAAGVTLQKMSKHLNGHKDHVNELHYKIVGIGTTN